MRTRALKIITAIVYLSAIILSIIWFDWKLAVIIFLALYSHNLDKHANESRN